MVVHRTSVVARIIKVAIVGVVGETPSPLFQLLVAIRKTVALKVDSEGPIRGVVLLGPGRGFRQSPPGRAVLDAAAFPSVEITAHQGRLRLGVGQAVEDWVHQRLLMGPARSGYLDAHPARQREVRATIAEALSSYRFDADDPMSGLAMDAASRVVAART